MKIGEKRIADFLDEVASQSPTPGGGAVAALTGALAAGLVEMVCNLTIGKKGYEENSQILKNIKSESRSLKGRLLTLADEDVKAFDKVIKAYKLRDRAKIKEALLAASDIPSKAAKLAKEVGRLAGKTAELGNKNAYSDAASAKHLAGASVKAAEENIKINQKVLASFK